MSKSLTESAAEILATSVGKNVEASKGTLADYEELGGADNQAHPEGTPVGQAAAAKVGEAPKPGQSGAPAEPVVDPVKKKPEENKVDGVEAMPGTSIDPNPRMAEEEEVEGEVIAEDEDDVELTEEEIDEYLNSLSEEELEELMAEAEALDEEEDEDGEVISEDEEEEDIELTEEEIAEARKAALKSMVAENMGSCKEDIDTLFSGEELSEEFKEKATTIFEAAVRARVEAIVEEVVTENEQIMEEAAEEFQDTLTEQVDEYLNYVVEQWMEDNQLAVETGLRVEIAEEFIGGLKNLFMEHYIEVPEEKADLVEEMAQAVAEMEEKLNEQVEQNAELNKQLCEAKSAELIAEAVKGLSTVQAEKIKALAEGVEFTTEGEYLQKLAVIRENYFPTKKDKGEAPESLVETEQEQGTSDTMSWYVDAISKSLPK
jgi:hypothetical protein